MRGRGAERQRLLEVGEEVGVDQHGAVVGVLQHERQLFGRHPHVEGVQDPPGAGHAEVRLEVTGAVPRQRGHPVPGRQPEVVEGVHELLGAPAERGVGAALHLARRGPADQFGLGCVAGRVVEEQPGVERGLHHRTATLFRIGSRSGRTSLRPGRPRAPARRAQEAKTYRPGAASPGGVRGTARATTVPGGVRRSGPRPTRPRAPTTIR